MTDTSREHLDDAISQLAEAWSKRSPAERSAFTDRLAAVPIPPDQPDSTLRAVRERAALSGAVMPSDLARGLNREEADRVLDLLAPEFDRVHAGGQWTWTLHTAPRRDALASLARDGRLPDRLAEVAGIQTDRAGELLRRLAETRSEETSVPDGDPAAVAQALTWARPLGGFDDDLAEAQRRAAVRLLREGYGVLTRHGVVGRERELARLTDFAEGPLDGQGPDSPVPLLPLAGIGGAGKSTLLGAFIKPYLARIEAGDLTVPAVVVLDFDRLLFRPTAELELSFEVTRQLGYAAPVAAADFSALRYQLRSEQRHSGSDRYVSNARSDSITREVSAFERRAGELVRMYQLQDRPVLLVLDTFEEWQRERPYPDPDPWNAPEQRILTWIGRLHTSMNLRNLRVIVSGRAGLSELGDFRRPGVRPALVVGDLGHEAARELLRALKVPLPDAGELAGWVGGNPLILHVAARFYLGLNDQCRRDLLAGDPLSAAELTDDIRQAVLYQRFLEHIPDEQVRKLAHPGLLLRRITPELVRHLLADPCGLGELDRQEAEQLTRRLADEVWLVQSKPDGLYHRRDVRGPMLKLMASDPEYRDVTRQIHAAAVSWYESNGNGRDRLLRPEQARLEAFYHSLMLETGDEPVAPDREPERERWLQLAHQLGQAVDELPAKVADQVRVLRGDQIPDQDAASLPDPVRRLWLEQRGRGLVDSGEPAAALALFDAYHPLFMPEWLGRACLDAWKWDRYWPIARALRDPALADSFLLSDRYALLNALLANDPEYLSDYQTRLMMYFYLRLEGADAAVSATAERLFYSVLFELGVPSGRPTPTADEVIRASTRSPVSGQSIADRFPVDQLRRVLTWIAAVPEIPDFVIEATESVASCYRPDPRWMRDFAAFAGIAEHAELGSYLDRFDRAAGGTAGLTNHQLLGEWSSGYAHALGRFPVRLRRAQVREAAGLIHVLRGDNPELRPAIQLALAELATDTGMRELAGIAEWLVPVPAADLRPSALTGGSGADRRTLIQLVEYVDRSGVMREFLTQARDAWPEHEPLRRVAEAFGIWDDVNNRLLAALADRLRDEHAEPSP
jgi:hypothetical protein